METALPSDSVPSAAAPQTDAPRVPPQPIRHRSGDAEDEQLLPKTRRSGLRPTTKPGFDTTIQPNIDQIFTLEEERSRVIMETLHLCHAGKPFSRTELLENADPDRRIHSERSDFNTITSFELNGADALTAIKIRAALKAHAATAVRETSPHCDDITCV
ncbi:hypothetical protein ROHU_009740 [Labeo rohita]|uniref:Uncharacterized protein n=1 Tax=Labeo rohita TaxID=84645 RepID=A0A498M2Q5_LABRO|nr:hypothetical protein ROHU_009740 [Labeo rohita]